MINGWLFFHCGREVFNFRDRANTYMLWKWRWRAGSAPGPWGPPGWRCTPPLASDQSAQRKWWCWAAERSSLHHCPESSQTQSHAWEHSAAKALLLHIFNKHHTLVGLWRVQGGKKWKGQSVGKRTFTLWMQSTRLYVWYICYCLEHYTSRTELFCRDTQPSSCDVTFCRSGGTLQVSKGLSLIQMEPPRHAAVFEERLLHMHCHSLRQNPKIRMLVQVLKQQR